MTDLVLREPEPRCVQASVDDVLDPFDACSDGEGFTDEDCQALSSDGLHKCFGTKDDHDPEHWCCCDEGDWPVEDEIPPGPRPREYVDISHLGNLRTPEADRPDREEPAWMRDAIRQSVEHVKDPELRRVLRAVGREA